MPSFIYYIQKSVAAAQLVRAHVRKRAFHLELIPTNTKKHAYYKKPVCEEFIFYTNEGNTVTKC
jgi:DNA-dependent RNA polymerase auxiliary subunit epsilon